MVILHSTRCTVDVIHRKRDAYLGGNMHAPTESTLKRLAMDVVSGGYDLDIGVDGDGEECYKVPVGFKYISSKEKAAEYIAARKNFLNL